VVLVTWGRDGPYLCGQGTRLHGAEGMRERRSKKLKHGLDLNLVFNVAMFLPASYWGAVKWGQT